MKLSGRDLRVELGFLRDNTLQGTYEGKTAQVAEGLEIYQELISTFLDKLNQWESPYDRKRAMEEMSLFGEGWSEIEWIQGDLRDIIEASIATENLEIIRLVSGFPAKLATLAFHYRDYYVFYKFGHWVPGYYLAAVPQKTGKNPRSHCGVFLEKSVPNG